VPATKRDAPSLLMRPLLKADDAWSSVIRTIAMPRTASSGANLCREAVNSRSQLRAGRSMAAAALSRASSHARRSARA
jgi:hypothetical protein